MTTTVAAIADLLRSVPCVDAPLVTRAAWFDRKADVFDRIAEAAERRALGVPNDTWPDADREQVEAQRMAMHARALASLIRRGRA
jgi:capsid protein